MVVRRYWVETLGCPKNQVDSDKLAGTLEAAGLSASSDPASADVVVVNTCAFIEPARTESIEVVLDLAGRRKRGARLVVTGCMAERYGDELAEALPEVDLVARFGEAVVPEAVGPAGAGAAAAATPAPGAVPVALGGRRRRPAFDLLELPRPPAAAPWAYVKVAEGCDRACGFCAIPSFRGPQRSRAPEAILAEVASLGVAEAVLVAQDLASYGRDVGRPGAIVPLVAQVAALVPRVRLLYLYPSELGDALVEAIAATGVPYFDLSLQHVSRPLVRRMRRWGDGERFLTRIDAIRRQLPDAAFRSSFIVGYPGETEEDHDRLLDFLDAAQLDWCGFFTFSEEDGTYAATLADKVPAALAAERRAELAERQDAITAVRRASLVGETVDVLVDRPGVARSHREAPEIDGIIAVPDDLAAGTFASVTVTGAAGPDLEARPVVAASVGP